MGKVENNLKAIYNEKETNVIPANIAKGKKIFGVEGNYEGAVSYEDYDECLRLATNIKYSQRTVIAPEIKATFVDKSGAPDGNMSSYNYCTIDGSNSWWYRALMKYDLSAVENAMHITKAEVHFVLQGGNDNYRESNSMITPITQDWAENTVTWNNQPTFKVQSAKTPTFSVNQNIGYEFVIDITDIVIDWIINKEPNYGLCFKAVEEGYYRNNWNMYNRRYNNGQYATYIKITCY